MLTMDIRTMDLSRIIELWDTDRETLQDELLEDYNMLKDTYRELTREYNQKSHKQSSLASEYYSHAKINYKKELGIDNPSSGHIKYTKDLAQNINIAAEYMDIIMLREQAFKTYQLKEIVRLKVREIERLLKTLGVKVNYTNDFENQADDWLKDDIITSKL